MWEQTGNKSGTELRTNREQIENKPGTEPRFLALSGLQRGTVLFMYSLCRAAGTRTTENLRLDTMASNLETTPGAVKETIKRLVAKGFIQRVDYRVGRGGFSSYALPEAIYRQLFELESGNKLGTNREQTGNKLGAQPGTQLGTSPSSSSSFIDSDQNSKTTTTGESELFDDGRVQLSPDWSAVDTLPLSEIGFTQTHLMQLAKYSKLPAAEVESSIAFFAFDLRRNGKAKTLNGPPLNFFMGILRKGIPYAPPENFESAADEARRRTREILERKDRDRQAEELRIFELEFSEWRRGLAPNDLLRLVPEWAQKPGQIQDSALKSYFETNLWPERAQEVFGLAKLDRVEIGKQLDQAIGEATR